MKYNLQRPDKAYIGKSKIKGRGVFALEDIDEGEVVEECHFIMCGNLSGIEDKNLLRYAKSFVYKTNQSGEKNEEASIKAALLLSLGDEEVSEQLKKDLVSLGYSEDLSDVFSTLAVLGFGMIYNHSKQYNLDFELDYENLLVRYSANRKIEKDEELLINYGHYYEL